MRGNVFFLLFSFVIKTILFGCFIIPVLVIVSPVALVVLPFYLYFEYKIRQKKIDYRIKERQSKNPFNDKDFELRYKTLINKKHVSSVN